jgi:hypothetical protein
LGLLPLQELLVRNGVTLSVEGQLNQLASEFQVLEIKEIFVVYLVVQVLFIGVELFNLSVLKIPVKVVVHKQEFELINNANNP